ncbi:hypothetical protein AA313_de0202605 [Arthrobotrys entomopaga]|nr:hypothetical protein AA313_de0202605 [Arthrobotrys entomopaga]
MALSLSSPDSSASPGFDRTQRLSSPNSKPTPLSNGVKGPDVSQNGTLHHPKGLKPHTSALLEIPTIQTSVPSAGTRTPSRSPKEKPDSSLPTIRTEGPSPTSTFGYSGRGTIKEARSRRRKPWRKLMWVKQNYPDNYTDATFLESLQRNANFRAYDFWPLVYDSTVIIQHISTVVVFVCAFIAISTRKVQPVYVAGTSTILTVASWLVWDEWNEEEQNLLFKARQAVQTSDQKDSPMEREKSTHDSNINLRQPRDSKVDKIEMSSSDSRSREKPTASIRSTSLSPEQPVHALLRSQSENSSSLTTASLLLNPDVQANGSVGQPLTRSQTAPASSNHSPIRTPSPPPHPTRANRRISTLKSALLIYSTLLGLSPILKSLTRATTSDSIWALSIWLFLVNLLCFDYGLSEGDVDVVRRGADTGSQIPPGALGPGGMGASFRKKLPTSLSTTTALAASVVLASRLTETGAVFSLLLFSIQIFGLFPLFRRRLRYLSSMLHISLTVFLILFAGACLHGILNWQWAMMWFGLVLCGGGGAAWVLMGMQRYKNEIRGPWDPARPVFSRRQWMD